MEIIAKPAIAKYPSAPRSTDRIMEALATLAALLDRTMNEVRTMESELQLRVLEAVQKKEESLQAETEAYVKAVRQEVHEELTQRSQSQLTAALEIAQSGFQTERERLRTEFDTEKELLGKELQLATGAASELQADRLRLMADLQRIREEANVEIDRVREEARIAAAAAVSSSAPAQPVDEIARTERKLAELISLIEDPMTELSVVIRKNVEKLELEAYLMGLRYAVSGKQ
jgi:hypothetical protein